MAREVHHRELMAHPETARAMRIGTFRRVRGVTEALAARLSPEDQQLQSMPACSPTKWHRAHTTWFFETFVLAPRRIPPLHTGWAKVFNSYYVGAGPRSDRGKRGLLSRPSVEEIAAYRRAVDTRIEELLETASEGELATVWPVIELGLAHEQQHQELLLTDILHAFSESPLFPAYRPELPPPPAATSRLECSTSTPLSFCSFEGGLVTIGHDPEDGFSFDNEEPRHRIFLEPFSIAHRLVTVREWRAFADDGGYERPSLWLSDGLEWARAHRVTSPLYTWREGNALVGFGLGGVRELHDSEPVHNVSFYEADAIARFLGARLPTEAEWEHAACSITRSTEDENFLEDGWLTPRAAKGSPTAISQLLGDAWEWTSSAYAPYPGFVPRAGVIGEYNGKFMVNQLVLRGGSCLTPRGHVRPSYRNFWPAETRFQMTGIRLARSP